MKDLKRSGQVKVSIIIPVYNGEEYLEQCIKSALNQTVEEIEIICVDDGSTDHSAEIIANLAKMDSRIIWIQQNNQGPGPARNTGLQQAKGEYIAFLDADDFYYDKNALELMIHICEVNGASVCGSKNIGMLYETGELCIKKMFPDKSLCNILNYTDYQGDYYYQNYLFRKKLLLQNTIYFPDYRRYQDPPFLVKTLYMAAVFVVADTCLYCYRCSDSVNKFDSCKTADLLKGILDNLIFAEEHNLDILFRTTAMRLEQDFFNTICENLSVNDLTILELLMKANQIIQKKYDYTIKPLRKILFSETGYQKQILKKITDQKEIVLYGAGKYARIFLRFLENQKCLDKVANLVVSDMKGNDSQIEGIPVISLKDYQQGIRRYMFIATGEGLQREISDNLKRYDGIRYEAIDDFFLKSLEKRSI